MLKDGRKINQTTKMILDVVLLAIELFVFASTSKDLVNEFSYHENIYPEYQAEPQLLRLLKNHSYPDAITVKFSAFKKTFTLNLSLNRELFGATYVEKSIDEAGEELYHDTNESKHCYYKGVITGDLESSVALSLCQGVIRGFFMTSYEGYHIEPAQSSTNNNNDQQHSFNLIFPQVPSLLSSSFRNATKSPASVSSYFTPSSSSSSPSSSSSFSSSSSSSPSSLSLGLHHIFRDSDALPKNVSCGNDHIDVKAFNSLFRNLTHNKRRNKRSIRWPYDADGKTLLVELYVANDNTQYRSMEQDVTKVIMRTKDIVNIVSSLYRPMNIYVSLVGVEVWTDKDRIDIVENADKTMNNFLEYRRHHISPKHHNDNAQLILGHKLGEGVVGKAPIMTICSWQYSGGVNLDHSPLVGPVATTVAHEMGHNFGLTHDTETCGCPDSRCIMAPSSGGQKNPTKWSVCSKQQFADALHQGMDYCLHNTPQKLFEGPVCGNGFVEEGEQCDCGLPQDCDNRCCDAEKCTLMENATCSMGKCCDLNTCRLKPIATECRPSAGECDLAEYCSGVNEHCPDDVFVYNGHPCISALQKSSYCYNGSCSSHDGQCQLLWGKTGRSSHRACYEQNIAGSSNGNCGFNWIDGKSFAKCESKDIMCGMLHCQHNNEKLMFWKEALAYTLPDSHVIVNGAREDCKGVILDVGLDILDPGMVPNGAKCSEQMMCVNQKCQPIHDISPKRCPDCNGNGICNSLFQCHCKPGYAPQFCDRTGHGGSIHSNPIFIQNQSNSLVTGLCLFFFFIIPILVFMAVCVFRNKKAIKQAWLIHFGEKYKSVCQSNPTITKDPPSTVVTLEPRYRQQQQQHIPPCKIFVPPNIHPVTSINRLEPVAEFAIPEGLVSDGACSTLPKQKRRNRPPPLILTAPPSSSSTCKDVSSHQKLQNISTANQKSSVTPFGTVPRTFKAPRTSHNNTEKKHEANSAPRPVSEFIQCETTIAQPSKRFSFTPKDISHPLLVSTTNPSLHTIDPIKSIPNDDGGTSHDDDDDPYHYYHQLQPDQCMNESCLNFHCPTLTYYYGDCLGNEQQQHHQQMECKKSGIDVAEHHEYLLPSCRGLHSSSSSSKVCKHSPEVIYKNRTVSERLAAIPGKDLWKGFEVGAEESMQMFSGVKEVKACETQPSISTVSSQPASSSLAMSKPPSLGASLVVPTTTTTTAIVTAGQPSKSFGSRRLEQIHNKHISATTTTTTVHPTGSKSCNIYNNTVASELLKVKEEDIYEEIDLPRVGPKLPPPPPPEVFKKFGNEASAKVQNSAGVPAKLPYNENVDVKSWKKEPISSNFSDKRNIATHQILQNQQQTGLSSKNGSDVQKVVPIKEKYFGKVKESPGKKEPGSELSLIEAAKKRRNAAAAATANARSDQHPQECMPESSLSPTALTALKQQAGNNNYTSSGMSSNSSSCSSGIGIGSSLVPSPSSASSSNATSSESHSSSSARSRFNKSPVSKPAHERPSTKPSLPPKTPATPPTSKVSSRNQGLRYKYQTEC